MKCNICGEVLVNKYADCSNKCSAKAYDKAQKEIERIDKAKQDRIEGI